MKTLTTAILVVFSATLIAQTTQLENLHNFDKLVIDGDVKSLKIRSHHHERPMIKIEGVRKEQVSSRIEAGILYLSLANGSNADVTVENSELMRIKTDEAVEIAGVDFIGRDGNYLITDIKNHDHLAKHFDINLSDIDLGDLDIDLPDIDFDFDFDHDHDVDIDVDFDDESWEYSYSWGEHKDEIRRVSREVKEEVKRAIEEVKREIKKLD